MEVFSYVPREHTRPRKMCSPYKSDFDVIVHGMSHFWTTLPVLQECLSDPEAPWRARLHRRSWGMMEDSPSSRFAVDGFPNFGDVLIMAGFNIQGVLLGSMLSSSLGVLLMVWDNSTTQPYHDFYQPPFSFKKETSPILLSVIPFKLSSNMKHQFWVCLVWGPC